MGLVGYSDSEGSDEEAAPVVSNSHPKTDASSKRSFQRVVDKAVPNKIRVNLPGDTEKPVDAGDKDGEPPSKKKRLGEGPSSGFNAILPTPKRTGVSAAGNAGGTVGLRKGVSLKTGAAPGFTREPMEPSTTEDDKWSGSKAIEAEQPDVTESSTSQPTDALPGSKAESPLKGKTTMFKPLSVARKPQKPKKKTGTASVEPSSASDHNRSSSATPAATNQTPKVSLFSNYTEDDHSLPLGSSDGDYQPMIFESQSNDTVEVTMEPQERSQQSGTGGHTAHTQADAPSLDTVAQDLNLSAAARRQLFGRSGKGLGANVITFDTDAEYNANEQFRANQDLEEVRNPVRSIAPGKHSLRQLVNSAVSQKEALEDSFATGRRNKKEAGSQYGW